MGFVRTLESGDALSLDSNLMFRREGWSMYCLFVFLLFLLLSDPPPPLLPFPPLPLLPFPRIACGYSLFRDGVCEAVWGKVYQEQEGLDTDYEYRRTTVDTDYEGTSFHTQLYAGHVPL